MIAPRIVGTGRNLRIGVVKLFTATPLSQFSDPSEKKKTEVAAPKPSLRPVPVPVTSIFPATENKRLRIVPIARLVTGGRWRIEAMRSLSEPLLLWFTRGQGRITIGGVTRGYGAHNAIFIPAGVMHGFDMGSQCHGMAVYFGQEAPPSLPQSPQHLRIRDVAPQAELSGLIDNIQRELDSGRAGSERAAHLHLGLLGVWLERQVDIAKSDEKKPDAARRLARRYTELLERDFRSGKGVSEYAHALGVTPTHLTRVCKQSCGRSASDLLHDRVIFEARLLLSETSMPIARVSDALGFTSAAYFTRAFQHRTGKTPSAFRKGN